MTLDINVKKLKKNAFRYSKVKGETASRVRCPGGEIDVDSLQRVVDIAQRDDKPLYDMLAFLRFRKVKARLSLDDALLMLDVLDEYLFEIEYLRLAVDECQKRDAVARLKLGVLIQRV